MASRHLQLFRNSRPFESYEDAVNYLNLNAPPLQDGTPILARYYSDDGPTHSAASVKTLLGIRFINGDGGTTTMTIINGDIDESKVNELIEEYISENLNYTDTPVQDEFVTAVDMSGGTLEISRAAISAEQISVDSTAFTATDVAGALDELKGDVADVESGLTEGLTVTMTKSADGLSYTLTQGRTDLGTIDIPKDMVVSSGEVITADGTEKQGTSESAETAGLTVGEKYVKMQLANADEMHNLVYINVKDLVDEYTVEENASQVQLAISSGNVISATIVTGSIGTQELADSAITEDKIADDAVTSNKIASGAVGTEEIVDGAITAEKLDSSLQDDLGDYLKVVKVNGVSAEPSNHVEEIVIHTDDLVVGEGVPGSEIVTPGARLNNILEYFEDKIISATSGVLTTVKFNSVISTDEGAGTIAQLNVDAGDLTVGDDYEPETDYTQITSADTVQTAIAKLDAAANSAVDVVSGNGINVNAVSGTNDKSISVKLSSDGSAQTASAVTTSGLEFDLDGGLYIVGLDAGTYTIV